MAHTNWPACVNKPHLWLQKLRRKGHKMSYIFPSPYKSFLVFLTSPVSVEVFYIEIHTHKCVKDDISPLSIFALCLSACCAFHRAWLHRRRSSPDLSIKQLITHKAAGLRLGGRRHDALFISNILSFDPITSLFFSLSRRCRSYS